MLAILRTIPPESPVTTLLDASITLRDGTNNIEGKPDISFSTKTYQKIAEITEDNTGDQILLPINQFFETLSLREQTQLYEMYRFAKINILQMDKDNWYKLQEKIQENIFNIISRLNLIKRLISFCQTPQFIYPDLSTVGTANHHSPAKTYVLEDYIEITAISLLSKLVFPISGEFISRLRVLNIDSQKVEKIAFDLIEPSLEEGLLERIYRKLYTTLDNVIKEKRTASDKKSAMSGVVSSYILTHNGIDDDMFNAIVMATIIVKRMAAYECFTRQKNGDLPPNAMVYIDNGIKRTTETRLTSMRDMMKIMPRKELPQHDTEDNNSIIDHASKTSKKPIDTPVFVVTAVEEWEIPRLIEATKTPIDVFNKASRYYANNSFDVSPLCQAMVASFIGTRFGGSKCLGYLPPKLYQQIVVLLQVYLIRNDLVDLASLISAKTPAEPVELLVGSMASRMDTNLKSNEYLQCLAHFKGWVAKPIVPFGKKTKSQKVETERLDFINHINKLRDWLLRYRHIENMAPALRNMIKDPNYPSVGADVVFNENVIRNLCRFYLMVHNGKRPF